MDGGTSDVGAASEGRDTSGTSLCGTPAGVGDVSSGLLVAGVSATFDADSALRTSCVGKATGGMSSCWFASFRDSGVASFLSSAFGVPGTGVASFC